MSEACEIANELAEYFARLMRNHDGSYSVAIFEAGSGVTEIYPLDNCRITQQLVRDAEANLRLSRRAKNLAARAALANGGHTRTDRAIAHDLGFHHCFVAKVRREVAAESGLESTPESERLGRDGKRRKRPIPARIAAPEQTETAKTPADATELHLL